MSDTTKADFYEGLECLVVYLFSGVNPVNPFIDYANSKGFSINDNPEDYSGLSTLVHKWSVLYENTDHHTFPPEIARRFYYAMEVHQEFKKINNTAVFDLPIEEFLAFSFVNACNVVFDPASMLDFYEIMARVDVLIGELFDEFDELCDGLEGKINNEEVVWLLIDPVFYTTIRLAELLEAKSEETDPTIEIRDVDYIDLFLKLDAKEKLTEEVVDFDKKFPV